MDFAALRTTAPLSRTFGADRGRPIDRHYIEGFLARHASDVRGRVLEFGDDAYTRRFGAGDVTRSDVLYPREGHPGATIVADIARPGALAGHEFDCIVCTQVLMYIYDVRAALGTLHDALAPGATLLATFPGISQISAHDMEQWGEYWRFTRASAQRLFADAFGAGALSVRSHGNVLAATGFLHGVTADELTRDELDFEDPQYEVTVTVRARRAPASAT
jgi:hypothetical protein